MFKYISGDLPATTSYCQGVLSWGFGKGKFLEIKSQVETLEVVEYDANIIKFSCTLRDGRCFIAQCDSITFDKIARISGQVNCLKEPLPIVELQVISKSNKLLSFLTSLITDKIADLNFLPGTVLSIPTNCRPFEEIVASQHQDQRVITHYLYKMDNMGSFFKASHFPSYAKDELGKISQILDTMIQRSLIAEADHAEVLYKHYNVEDLKAILKFHGLKLTGNKMQLAQRLLESVPFEAVSGAHQEACFSLTESGKVLIKQRESDYHSAVISAINCIKARSIQDAVQALNRYDEKWGFTRSNGKFYTIFAGYPIATSAFKYLLRYPMRELQNSETFKTDLRAFLFVALIRGKRYGYSLIEEFQEINSEPIKCPGIIAMYKQRSDNTDPEEIKHIISGMKDAISEDPDKVLEYYISRIIYQSVTHR